MHSAGLQVSSVSHASGFFMHSTGASGEAMYSSRFTSSKVLRAQASCFLVRGASLFSARSCHYRGMLTENVANGKGLARGAGQTYASELLSPLGRWPAQQVREALRTPPKTLTGSQPASSPGGRGAKAETVFALQVRDYSGARDFADASEERVVDGTLGHGHALCPATVFSMKLRTASMSSGRTVQRSSAAISSAMQGWVAKSSRPVAAATASGNLAG